MKVKIVEPKYREDFEREVNEEIKKNEKEGKAIKDIKYSAFVYSEYDSPTHSALIIFE